MREGISFDSVAFSSLPEVIRDIGKRHLATKSKREYDCYKDCFSILDMFKSCYPQEIRSIVSDTFVSKLSAFLKIIDKMRYI